MDDIQEILKPKVNKKVAISSYRSFATIGKSSIPLGYFLLIVAPPCLLPLLTRRKAVLRGRKPVLRRRMGYEYRTVMEIAQFYQMVPETHNLLPTDYLMQAAIASVGKNTQLCGVC